MSNNIIERQIQSSLDTIKYCNKEILSFSELNLALGHFDELDDVISVSCYQDYLDETEVTYSFTLNNDKQDSKLIHKLSQILQVDFEKKPAEYYKGLEARGVSKKYPKWTIVINNYVPTNCKLVETTVDIPEEQWIKTKKVFKVDCSGAGE